MLKTKTKDGVLSLYRNEINSEINEMFEAIYTGLNGQKCEMSFIYFTVGKKYEVRFAGSSYVKVKSYETYVTMTNEEFNKSFNPI